MFTKLYAQIKKYVLENLKEGIIFLVLFIISVFPLPYYIDAPGGAIDISKKITIDDGYSSKGSFNFAYVSELRATPITYIISFFKKDWEVLKKSEVKYNNETVQDMEFRNKLLLEESNDDATIVAYRSLHKEVEIEKERIYITYISEKAKTDLKIGDELLTIEGESIVSRESLRRQIQSHQSGDTIYLTVRNNKKEYNRKAILIEEEGQVLIGAMMNVDKELKTNPHISIKKDQNESGPSGGLMLTLAIYNCLTEEDITGGRKIVGTGTIDVNGSVGSIGGVEFKLKGAVKEKADIFLVPAGENYEQAIQLKRERNYKIEIKAIRTFEEAVTYLKNKKD